MRYLSQPGKCYRAAVSAKDEAGQSSAHPAVSDAHSGGLTLVG